MTKKRKILIFSFVLLLLFFILGLYVFLDYLNYKKEMEESQWETPKFMEYESVENFVVEDNAEGKMVVNENAGLSFMVPEGWNVEKVDEGGTYSIMFSPQSIKVYSPDMIKKEFSIFPTKGCIIESSVEHYIETFPGEEHRARSVLKQIQGEKEMTSEELQKVVSVNNYSALETTFYRGDERNKIIWIELPVTEDLLYSFRAFIIPEEEERCSEEFSNFLESISIDI